LLIVILSRPALSHDNFEHVSGSPETRIHDILDERDPDDTGDCLSLGELDLVFRTNKSGPPHIGVVLTDPRGRRLVLILLPNIPGRHYRSRKVTWIAMIWAARIPA
jgi:hypothetical protein